jgi:hypothetical protein
MNSLDCTSSHSPAPLLHSRKSAAFQLSVSIRSLDYLISTKKLATTRLGKKIMIAHAELVKFVKGNHCGPMKDAA